MVVLDIIKKELENINGSFSTYDTSYVYNCAVHNVSSNELYLDEIHDFPSLMLSNPSINFIQLGGNLRYKVYNCRIRGIVLDEENIEAAELLAQDVEHVLHNYRKWEYVFQEVRLIRVETDAGVNAPLGAMIVSFAVLDLEQQ